MSETANPLNRAQGSQSAGLPGADFFGPARVLDVEQGGARIQVMLGAAGSDAEPHAGPRSVWADRAMPFECAVGWGDCVLVAGSEPEDLYVIGVLGAPKSDVQPTAGNREIELANGMRAQSPDGESLSVYAADGRVLFRHEGESGRSRIDLPDGDVEFVAGSGSIDFVAAENIRFTSKAEIQLSSLAGVRIAAHDALEKVTSMLNVSPRKLGIESEELDLKAHKAQLSIDQANYRGKRLGVMVGNLKSIVKRSESYAETLIEKAKNSYRSVSALSQLTAGRARTVVEGAYQLRSKDAFLKSDEVFKIDGEKIHLG